MNNKNIPVDVFQIKDFSESLYEVVDVKPINSLLICNENEILHASKLAIELVKIALSAGKRVLVPKLLAYSEVTPSEITIDETIGIDAVKNAARHFILNLMNTNVTRVNILNVIDYMQCYMKLMNRGIFITDDNREDKYFEIIEAAQSIEEPQPLNEDASFEQQYEYSVSKQKYDAAQDNLKTLEIYLNSFDKLSKINFIHNLLHSMLDKVDNADSIESIDAIISENMEIIKDYFYSEK